MKKRNLSSKPKRRKLPIHKRKLFVFKPKFRKKVLKGHKDSYYIRKIIKSMSIPHREGGGTLFEQGLWEFFKLDFTYIPRKIFTKMENKDLIERVHCKGFGARGYYKYKLIIKKKKKRKL